MADEAEKLINLSLCKMAESRTIRRGGTSLHKHLLISTVLTKARSAYFETWYMGEGEAIDSRSGRPVDLNSSYQELEFPLDDDDDDDELDSANSYYEEEVPNSNNSGPEVSSSDLSSSAIDSNDKNVIDPRFFVEVGTDNESEIDLPSDILNCVEKMGDISDMSFGVDDTSASQLSGSANVVVSNVLIESVPNPQTDEHLSQSTQLVYLDLDSRGGYAAEETELANDVGEKPETELDGDDEPVFGSPPHTSTPRPNAPKRRRNWSIEEESEDDEKNSDCSRQSFQFPFSDEIRNKQTLVSKRLRFSPTNEDDDSGVSNMSFSQIPDSDSPSSLNYITMGHEFRTKKSHFEEDEQEDSDDDPFLGDALGPNIYSPDSDQLLQRRKNDQRVPSASGGSSSDEDGDQGESQSSKEVDQITNLVQIISFSKHQPSQPQLQQSSLLRPIYC